MKLKVLNSLKDNKFYRDITFTSINKKKSNEIMKNDCFILLSNNLESNINLLNSELCANTYFKSIYVPKKLTNTINTTKLTVKAINQYKEINSKLKKPLVFKNTLPEYQRKNIYVDFSRALEFYFQYLKTTGTRSLDSFYNELFTLIASVKSYKNIAIVVPVSTTDIGDLAKFQNIGNLSHNTTQFMYFFLKFKKLQELAIKVKDELPKNNVTFIFKDTSKNIFFKVKLTGNFDEDENSLKRFTNAFNYFKRLLRNCNQDEDSVSKEILENEVEEEIKEIPDNKTKIQKINNQENFIINKSNEVVNSFLKNIGIKNPSNSQLEIIDKLSDSVVEIIQNTDFDTVNDKKILEMLDSSEEFKQYLKDLKDSQILGKNEKISANQEKLITNQEEALKENISIAEILNSNNDIKLEEEEFKIDKLIFNNVKKNNVKSFDNSYVKNNFKKDILNTLMSFNDDEDIPMYITNVKMEDTSNDMTKKQTMTVKYKDTKNVIHIVKIDIPVILEDRYVFINGSKKLIQKQLLLKPIVKTKSDTVQITTDYNKFFIKRFGQKLSENIEVLKKIFLDGDFKLFLNQPDKFKVKIGDISNANLYYPVNIYYQSFAEFLLKIEADNIIIDFDYDLLNSMTNKSGSVDYDVKLSSFIFDKENYHIIGYLKDKSSIFLVNKLTNEITALDNDGKVTHFGDSGKNLVYFITSIMNNFLKPEYQKKINSISRPKSLMYNRIAINNKKIPLIIVLGYEYGLMNVISRYGIDMVFTSTLKKPNLNVENTMRIRFKNGYLYYDASLIRNSLLLSGLSLIDTENYEISEFEKNGIPYIDYFNHYFGSRNTGKGLHNTISLMIDPKTKDILTRLNLPTNIFDLLLYANTLLENNTFQRANNLGNYRLRGVEQVNAVLYKILADSFRTYKDTSKNGNPIKVSVPQDILLKKLVELSTVDEMSDANPTLELEKGSSVTFSGPSGLNSNDAYTPEIRAYDGSMVGILGAESPDNAKVGAVRFLSYNTSVLNTLGFLDSDATKNIDNATNMYSVGELLNPFTSKHADPARLTMQVQQQRQILTIDKPDRPLFGSGVEKAVPYLLSDTFVFKAKKDGKITKIDEEKSLVLLEYDDGTTDIIDLNPKMLKNSGGGFYLKCQLELLMKSGKFKKNDILARDKMYLTGNTKDDITYSMGKNSFVAVASSDLTYEDSSFISSDLSNNMMSKMTDMVDLSFAPKTNIEFLAKKGTHVKTGDSLVIFENAFEDEEINDILTKLGSDFGEAVNALSKNTIRSKYTGNIVDFRIYYNLDIEEYSPSIQKLIKTYINKAKQIRNIIDEYANKNSIASLNLPIVKKIEGDKIKTRKIEGIRIELYIEHEDYLGVGDKIRYNSCKTIISRVLDKREMPYSDYTGEEGNLDAVLSPLSIVSRMTTDLYSSIYLGKCIKYLKRKVKEIIEE